MAQNTQYEMSSQDANVAFKSKVNESLPLLGYLNIEDKGDVWRFWKMVSSAVKIAVNGKGDFIETSRRNSRVVRNSKDKQLEEHHLQKLQRNAITIYVPVQCPDKSLRKYRVLKLANQKKIADYIETVASEGENIETQVFTTDDDLETVDITVESNQFQGNVVKNEAVVELERPCIDDSLGDARLAPSGGNQPDQSETQGMYEPVVSTDDSSSKTALKPGKKIWPVGRPTTRSSSCARVIKTPVPENSRRTGVKSEAVNGGIVKKEEDQKPECVVDNSEEDKEVEINSITFFPQSVKQETLESHQDDFSITLVGDNVVHISQNNPSNVKTVEHFQEYTGPEASTEIVLSQTMPCSQGNTVSVQYSEGCSQPTAQREMCIQVSGEEEILKSKEFEDTLDSQHRVHSLQGVGSPSCELEMGHQVSIQETAPAQEPTPLRGQLVQRNVSDIETIISALEEELKKAGSSAPAISSDGEAAIPACSSAEVSLGNTEVIFEDGAGQAVQFLNDQEIVEVQQVDNVIWTTEGDVRILEADQVISTNGDMVAEGAPMDAQTISGVTVSDGIAIDAQYDVVENEVIASKKKKRGRKKKIKDEATFLKEDKIDRTCPICQRVLHYASSMAAHMRIHTGVRPYSCGQCDRKFTTKANRDRHEATHVGLKPFQCASCNKCFTEKRSLNVHMRTHTGERPFVCQVCGRGFTQKCTLTVHMDRHTNKKGHLCDLCGKAFRQKCQLDIHVKRHNRQASYPCTECSTKCYTRGDLVRHMIKHTGERPFQCSECPRAFTRRQYLIDHENVHFGRKPYQCSVCAASFHDMGSCHRHLRKHRLEVDEEDCKGEDQSAVLSSGDFHRILEGTQIGQILKLEDGTDAIVKAVLSEADGSTVYHISCLGRTDNTPKESEDVSEALTPTVAPTVTNDDVTSDVTEQEMT